MHEFYKTHSYWGACGEVCGVKREQVIRQGILPMCCKYNLVEKNPSQSLRTKSIVLITLI